MAKIEKMILHDDPNTEEPQPPVESLVEENERLRRELEETKTQKAAAEQEAHPYDNLTPELDGRQRGVMIVYGPNSQNLKEEILTLQKAFNTLVGFYSQFGKPTDRNVPREYINALGAPEVCNQAPCYVKKTFKDERSGQEIKNLRKEVPLWLAVDDVVQKGQRVELITIKEFDEFYNEEVKKEIRLDRAYRDKKRQQLVEEVLQEG